jgi:hypothetical protein
LRRIGNFKEVIDTQCKAKAKPTLLFYEQAKVIEKALPFETSKPYFTTEINHYWKTSSSQLTPTFGSTLDQVNVEKPPDNGLNSFYK